MYRIEKDKPFYSSLMFLKYTYAIPDNMEQLTRFIIIFGIIRISCFVAFFIIPCIHLIITIKEGTGVDVSEDLSTMLGSLGVLIIIVSIFILYDKLMQFFVDLDNCKKFGIHPDFDKLIKKLNLYSTAFVLYTLLAVAVYAVVALTETSYCKKFNEEHGLKEICGTFSPVILPFDASHVGIRVAIFLIQMVLAVFTFSSGAVACFLFYEVVAVLRSHVTHLKDCFTNIFNEPINEERRHLLRFCVYYHINLLSLSQRLSTLVKQTCGNLCITCALVFGCIGNLVIKAKPIAGLCYLMGYMVALFSLCYGGQIIMDEMMSVGDALYISQWYNSDPKIVKDICFIIARSHKPQGLKAVPLGLMNYSLFLLILKTSYSYLTLLSNHT